MDFSPLCALLISRNQFDSSRVQLSSGRFLFSFPYGFFSVFFCVFVCFPFLVFLFFRHKFCKFIATFVRLAHYWFWLALYCYSARSLILTRCPLSAFVLFPSFSGVGLGLLDFFMSATDDDEDDPAFSWKCAINYCVLCLSSQSDTRTDQIRSDS